MTTLTLSEIATALSSLRAEHREMSAGALRLRTTADSIGSVSLGDLRTAVGEAAAFLDHHLLPHATGSA